MGVPTSEVGYTSAMPRREDHEVHKDMWGHGGGITFMTPVHVGYLKGGPGGGGGHHDYGQQQGRFSLHMTK